MAPKPFVFRREYSNRYEGMFKNGMKNGLGVFFYSDGSCYQGEWQDDLKHGFAYFTDLQGNTKQLIFRENKQFKRLDEERDLKYFHTVNTFHTTQNTLARTNTGPQQKDSLLNTRGTFGKQSSPSPRDPKLDNNQNRR